MGRAPCCDKANVKKGSWAPEEDAKLKAYIDQHGTGGNWIALPQKVGLKRCGKSCRLRWLNYLRPNIKHGGFSEEEDNVICSLYISIGSRWSIIAAQLPGRTDNDIKNYWNTKLKKKLLGKQRKEQQARRVISCPKQEMKEVNGNYFMVGDSKTQISCWPEQHVPTPLPYPNQDDDPRDLNDHASIRKLLMIKLGGRLIPDDHRLLAINNSTNDVQFPAVDISSSTQQQFYHEDTSMLSSSSSINNSLNHTCSQFPNSQYHMMQELNNSFPVEFEFDEMIYSNPQRLDGTDQCFFGVDMVNGSTGTYSADSSSLDDTSSLQPYPPTTSNYEAFQQGILQKDHAVGEECNLRYLGSL